MKNSFEPIDFFIMRTPILTIEDYKEVCNKSFDYIYNKFFKDNQVIQEAIYLGSPILYYNLVSLNSKNEDKKFIKIKRSFYKYLIRMSTRSTPFGLFAGISDNYYSSNTIFNMYENNNVNKRIKLNTKWVLKLVQELENDSNIITYLTVVKNPDLSKSKDEYILPYRTYYGQVNNNINQTVKTPKSSILDYIYLMKENPIKVIELSRHLEEEFNISKEHSIKILQSLINDEFLISNLKPMDINNKPLRHIINILREIDSYKFLVEKLISIDQLISKYCELPLGEGLETLKNILILMRSLVNIKAKTLLQVDTKFKYQNNQLNKKVAYDFAKGVEILYQIAVYDNSITPLKRFHIDFIRKYGRDREVLLIELLDEDSEINVSNFYSNKYQTLTKDNHNEGTWVELITQSLLKKQDIHLDGYNLKELFGEGNLNIPESVDVLGEIIAPSYKDIDKGQYTIVLGSMTTLNSMGRYGSRFFNMIENEKFYYLKEKYSEIQKKDFPNELILEPKFIAPTGFTSNLVSERSVLPNNLVAGIIDQNNNSVTLSDILIGVENENFYIKSLSTKKRLIIKSFDMVSRKYYPTPIRLLLDISQGDMRIQRPYELITLQNIDYIPRISYKNIILFPATWLFKAVHSNCVDDEILMNKFLLWKTEHNIPDLVYIGLSDQKMLINLTKKEFLIELLRLAKKDKKVRLFEMVGELNDRWVGKKDNHLFSEVVVSLINNSFSRNNKVIKKLEYNSVEKNDRFKAPGSEWLFIKIYSPKHMQNCILKEHLYPFISNNLGNKIKKFFYTRYEDQNHHIRIRFEIEQENKNSFFNEILQLIEHLNSVYFIQKIVIDTYEREIERYGGINLIGYAEEIFFIDSLLSLNLLEIKNNNIPKEFIYMLSIFNIINQFLSTSEEKSTFLKKYKNKAFTDMRFAKLNFKNHMINQKIEKESQFINSDNIEYFNGLVNKYRCFIDDEIGTKELTDIQERILHSLIHMHLNRLIGIDRELENKILNMSYQYFCHIFYSQTN